MREMIRNGFTLIEILIVISLMGILAGAMIVSINPSIHDRLEAGARYVAADVDYCRNLAVMNNSSYAITFDLNRNRYIITHTGSNAALDNLPPSPFYRSDDPPDRHTADMETLPGIGATVALEAVTLDPVSGTPRLEFGPLGETTNPEETVIWLSAGAGAAKRYMTVTVNPITGLTKIGSMLGKRD